MCSGLGLFYKNSDDYRRNVQPALVPTRLDNATFMKQVYNEFYSDPSILTRIRWKKRVSSVR